MRGLVWTLPVLLLTGPAFAATQSYANPFRQRGVGEIWYDGSLTVERHGLSALTDSPAPGDLGRFTLFYDGGKPGDLDRAQFYYPYGRATIIGVDVYVLADGGVEDGVHGVSSFSMVDIGGKLLVDRVNPRDDGLASRYLFDEPVTSRHLLLGFTRSSDAGPRVLEVYGIVPEPSSAAALVGLGLLLLRRRARTR